MLRSGIGNPSQCDSRSLTSAASSAGAPSQQVAITDGNSSAAASSPPVATSTKDGGDGGIDIRDFLAGEASDSDHDDQGGDNPNSVA